MPDTVAWCVLACFRITSVFVRLGFQFLESACECMISILHGHLAREIKQESKSKNPDVQVISSSKRRKISHNNNQRKNGTTSCATSNLTDKISPRNGKCRVGNETYCSNHGRQRADYLTTRGISFIGSEIFECNLRQAKKVIVAFEFLPDEEGASSTQFVGSRTDHAANSLIRKSDSSDVEHSENSSFQKDVSKGLQDGTEQCRKYPETKSDKNINDENLASCKTRGLFKDTKTSSEILDIETKDKEDLKLNYGEWSIDISKDDCSLNLVVQEREEVEELNLTEDIQDDPHSKPTEKVGNILQSENINLAEDKTLQRSDTQGIEHVFSEKEIERIKPQIHGDAEEKERFGDDKAVKPKEMQLSKETMTLKISPKKSNKAFSPQILLEKSNITNQQHVNKDEFEVGKPEAIPKQKCVSDIPQGQIETKQSQKLPPKDKSFKDMGEKKSKHKNKPEQQKVLTETVEKSNQSYDSIRDNFVQMKVISPKTCGSKKQQILKDSKSSIKNENKNRSEEKSQILSLSENALELEFQEHESRKAQQKMLQVKEMDHSKYLVKESESEQQCRDFDIETTLPKYHDKDKATHLDISNLSVEAEDTKYPLEKETETALSKSLPEKGADGEQTQFEYLEKTKMSEIDHENKSKNLSSSSQTERESLTNTILDKSVTSLSKVNTKEECELIQPRIHPDKNMSQTQVSTNEHVQQQTVKTDRVQENIELKRGVHYKKDDSVEDQRYVEHQDEIQIKLSNKILKESLEMKTTENYKDQELQKGMQTDTVEPITERDSLNATERQKNEMEETFPSESDSLDKSAPVLESTTDKESSDVHKIEIDNTLFPTESAISEDICKETRTSHYQKDFKTNKIIDSDEDAKDLKDNVIRKITFSSSSSDASIETLYNDIYEKGPSIVLPEDFLIDPNSAGKSYDGKVGHSEFDNEKNTINALNEIDIKLYNTFTGNEILEKDLGSLSVDLKCDIGRADDDYDPMREIPKYWERIRVEGDKFVLERSEIKCFSRNLDYLETQTDDNTKVGTINDETVTSVDSLPEIKVCDFIENFQSYEDREYDNIKQSSRPNFDKGTRHVQKDRMSDDMDTSTSDESEIIPQIYSDHSPDATYIKTVANPPNTETTNSMSKLLAFELPNESIVSCSEAVSKVDKAESILPDTPQTDEKTEKLTSVTPENKIAGQECENIQKKATDSPNEEIDYTNDSQEGSFRGDILVQNTLYIPLDPDFLLNPFDGPTERYDVKSDIKKLEFDEEYSADKWNRSDKIFYYNVMGRDVPESASSISCSKNSIGEVETFHDPTLRIPTYCDGLCVINGEYVLGKREIKAFDKGQTICTEEDLKELSENTQEATCRKLKIVKVPAHSPPKRRKTSVITDVCPLNKHEKLDSVQRDTDASPEAKQESRDSPKDSPPELGWYELTIAAEKLKGMAMSSGASDDSADSSPEIG